MVPPPPLINPGTPKYSAINKIYSRMLRENKKLGPKLNKRERLKLHLDFSSVEFNRVPTYEEIEIFRQNNYHKINQLYHQKNLAKSVGNNLSQVISTPSGIGCFQEKNHSMGSVPIQNMSLHGRL
jgi:hypothetical protein